MEVNNQVSYSAVVLDEPSRQTLKTIFGNALPKDWDWIGHHLTICMGPLSGSGLVNKVGDEVTLCITAVGRNDKAMACRVDGFYSKNKVPHVTLGVNRLGGGKPKDSNGITEWQDYDFDVRLRGTIQEV